MGAAIGDVAISGLGIAALPLIAAAFALEALILLALARRANLAG